LADAPHYGPRTATQGLFAWLVVPSANQFGHCLADRATAGL